MSCRRKLSEVSFHEEPAETSLRDKWLHAILGDAFSSTTIKEHSVVCSLHIHASDFKKDFTRRLLKPGGVPSVFSEPVTSLARNVESTTAASVSTSTTVPTAHGELFPCLTQPENTTPANVSGSPPVEIEHSNEGPAKSLDSDDSNGGSELAKNLVQTKQVEANLAARVPRKRWREKERALKVKNERLSRTVDAYKQELLKLKEAAHVSAFIEVTSRRPYYPTQELVKVLVGLRRFAACVLSQRRSVKKPLDACVQRPGGDLQASNRIGAPVHLNMALPRSSSCSDVDDMESEGGYVEATNRRLKGNYAGLQAQMAHLLEHRTAGGLSVEDQVLCALRFFATGSFQSSVGSEATIRMSQSSVSRCIARVAQAIVDVGKLRGWVAFPRTAFERAAVCDSDMKILSIDPRFAGSCHDGHVWRNSGLRRRFMSGRIVVRDGEFLLGE
ncbi:hypothetical protein HPB52_003545 [Rhipicephalus sanguineus]|uniref:THAP-type domain-containing protein n=1 Tax=Rhipicephalus sanguineus TaxID=34632 RepID=A0A9D4QIV6_RHISA|nr:hypothetical protein HPB52_003545 [Rhipicephalus sanguineus]